jgi:hypothetical protein
MIIVSNLSLNEMSAQPEDPDDGITDGIHQPHEFGQARTGNTEEPHSPIGDFSFSLD